MNFNIEIKFSGTERVNDTDHTYLVRRQIEFSDLKDEKKMVDMYNEAQELMSRAYTKHLDFMNNVDSSESFGGENVIPVSGYKEILRNRYRHACD